MIFNVGKEIFLLLKEIYLLLQDKIVENIDQKVESLKWFKFNFNLPYLPFFIRLDFITTDRGMASSSRLNDILRVINEFSITQRTVVIME